MSTAIPASTDTPQETTAAVRESFQSGWDDLWGAVTAGAPGITDILTMVGVAIVVLSLMQWAWQAKKGARQGQAAKPVWGALIIGSILTAPGLLMPVLLGILDVVVNVALSFLSKAGA